MFSSCLVSMLPWCCPVDVYACGRSMPMISRVLGFRVPRAPAYNRVFG